MWDLKQVQSSEWNRFFLLVTSSSGRPPQSIYTLLLLLPLISRGTACLHSAAVCCLCLRAQPVALFLILHLRLVAHGAVALRIVLKHWVVVRGRICDDSHEEGNQRGVVNEGEKEGRVDREDGDGTHRGYNSRGRRLHSCLAELYGAGVADAAHLQRHVRYPRKIRSRKQRAKAWFWQKRRTWLQT